MQQVRSVAREAQSPHDLPGLAAVLNGELLLPGAPAYEEARLVWNRVHDTRPAAIVHAADARDVGRTVAFAREAGMEIAVRSGGHSLAGYSTGDGVLVVDLRRLRGLHVDPASRHVFAGAGLPAGDVTDTLAEHGLAIPFGDTGTVGIAGLTLGGGIGFLARKFGLAIDRLRGVEVVTAHGELVTASADENQDLFWAVRGGGGNFGIVTRFEYEAVPVEETLAGALFLPLTLDVLRGVMSLAASAPEELTTITNIMPTPPAPFIPADAVGTPSVIVMLVYAGDPAEGQKAVEPFRRLATPIAEMIAPMPYPGIYQFTVEAGVPGPNLTRSFFGDDLDDDALGTIVDRMGSPTTPSGAITQLRAFGGEMSRVDADATAFAHRKARIMFSIFKEFEDPSRVAEDVEWTEAYFAELAPAATGVYVNFLEREGEARIRQAYPEATYRRLADAKARWDPDNLFNRNQNIRPT